MKEPPPNNSDPPTPVLIRFSREMRREYFKKEGFSGAKLSEATASALVAQFGQTHIKLIKETCPELAQELENVFYVQTPPSSDPRTEELSNQAPPPPEESQESDRSTLPIDSLIEEFGPPVFRNDKNKISHLNEPFWAALYAREKLIIYLPEEDSFYQYCSLNGLYEEQTNNGILQGLERTIFHSARSWDSEFATLSRFRSTRCLTPVIAHLRAQTELLRAFEHPYHPETPLHIAVKNGVLALNQNPERPPELLPFSPTYQLRSGVPFSYDPAAACPQFLKTMFGHISQADQSLIQKFGGMCLLGTNCIQRFLILDGVANSSKSELLNIIRGIVGASACAELRTAYLDNRFEIGAIARAKLLFGSDVPGDFLLHEGAARLKSLVGNDLLDCEAKNSNRRTRIHGNFIPWLTSNATLHHRLDGDRSAWQRRLLRVSYSRPYQGERIDQIARYLLQIEAPGILNFFLAGARFLLADLKACGDISIDPSHLSLINTLLDESESLPIFLKTALQPAPHGDSHGITTELLVQSYITFCQQRNWAPLPLSLIHRSLPSLMLSLFAATESHSLRRPSPNQLPNSKDTKFINLRRLSPSRLHRSFRRLA